MYQSCFWTEKKMTVVKSKTRKRMLLRLGGDVNRAKADQANCMMSNLRMSWYHAYIMFARRAQYGPGKNAGDGILGRPLAAGCRQRLGRVTGREEVVSEDLLQTRSLVGLRTQQSLDEIARRRRYVRRQVVFVGRDAYVRLLQCRCLEWRAADQHGIPVGDGGK